MDRKVIKLEAAFGSERQSIVVKRNQELVVADVMEDVQRVYKIPIAEQVIFHKGTNLCDFPSEKLENLGVENNHMIRITRDPELPNRSPRPPVIRNPVGMTSGQMSPRMMQQQMMQPGQGQGMTPRYPNGAGGLDPVSYLKEIAPQRVPDPTPYQMQVYK